MEKIEDLRWEFRKLEDKIKELTKTDFEIADKLEKRKDVVKFKTKSDVQSVLNIFYEYWPEKDVVLSGDELCNLGPGKVNFSRTGLSELRIRGDIIDDLRTPRKVYTVNFVGVMGRGGDTQTVTFCMDKVNDNMDSAIDSVFRYDSKSLAYTMRILEAVSMFADELKVKTLETAIAEKQKEVNDMINSESVVSYYSRSIKGSMFGKLKDENIYDFKGNVVTKENDGEKEI